MTQLRSPCASTWKAPAVATIVRLAAWAVLASLAAAPAWAQRPTEYPTITSGNATPIMMLNLTKDDQLTGKAYNEYMDLGRTTASGLPKLERTFVPSLNYYGYFNPKRCYTYSNTNKRFEPGDAVSASYKCGGQWSGNFLNWVSMSRMDVIRKILYGGARSTDTADTTVLERQHTPPDSHSYAKWVRGADLENGVSLGDLTPFSQAELTICVVSKPRLANDSYSQNAEYAIGGTNPPLLRVVAGNYLFWGTGNERQQCLWKEERDLGNGNDAAVTGINAARANPKQADDGLGEGLGMSKGEFAVRVQVCVPGKFSDGDTDEICKAYPSGNFKPIGLLQKYGEPNELMFGLMTGSFDRRVSGGVLRSNVASFRDEVNYSTDGTFSTVKGIVYNLNRIRLYGYRYAGEDGYQNSEADNCNYQLSSDAMVDGSVRCRSWGNPSGEIFVESLRYLAGKTADSRFTYTENGSADAALGLTLANWQDPLNSGLPGVRYCSRLNVLNFNASTPSFDTALDHNEVNRLADLGDGSGSAIAQTNLIGAKEGINGRPYSFGRKAGSTGPTLCSTKVVTSLGEIDGVCPESPSKRGSWLIAGAAWWAHTNRIRTSVGGATIPAGDKESLKVTTYGVSLATNTPRIRIPVGQRFVTLQPAYYNSGPNGSGTLVDFKVLQLADDYSSGKFYVSWEDSEQGGDYDNDIWGILDFTVSGNTITVGTKAQEFSSGGGQGFGYIINGVTSGATSVDGPYFHSGGGGWNWTSPYPSVAPSCSNCNAGNARTTGVFSVAAESTTNELQEPLWYAAKWGGFDTAKGTKTEPASNADWDKVSLNGAAVADGIPDNYFFAKDPRQLVASLEQAFKKGRQSTSGARAAVSTARVLTDALIYQSSFEVSDAGQWIGALKALNFGTSGAIGAQEWDVATSLTGASLENARTILTRNAAAGTAFRWSNLSAAQQTLLNRNASGTADTLGQRRLSWLRGSEADETGTAPVFRRRAGTKLGDIVNSGIWYVAAPNAGYRESQATGYNAFATAQVDRKPMVYVGANDGMLHGFDAGKAANGGGRELLAYVPSMLMPKLPQLSDPLYAHRYFVDSTPIVGDANVTVAGNTAWRSILVGALGGGGQGVYALNVTDPTAFSEANAANLALWEFKDSDDPDLGYMVSQATQQRGPPLQMGKFANGKWGIVLGNGVYSEEADGNAGAGRSVLYVLFLDGPGANGTWTEGVHYRKIVAGNGPGNGLSMPVALDTNGDGTLDTVYAGDLSGKLWKFDLSSANPASWGVAYSGTPLFAQAQPITTQVIVQPTQVTGTLSWLVSFGTGKLYETSDQTTTTKQSIYGVLDANAAVTGGRAALREQTVVDTFAGTNNAAASTFRVLSYNPVCFTATTAPGCTSGNIKKGWYIELPDSGERVVYNPSLDDAGGFIYPTYIPPTDVCSGEGSSYLMRIDGLTGGRINGAAGQYNWDTNGDGQIGGPAANGFAAERQSDGIKLEALVPGGSHVTVGPANAAAVAAAGGKQPICRVLTNPTALVAACNFRNVGRVSWRELTPAR